MYMIDDTGDEDPYRILLMAVFKLYYDHFSTSLEASCK
jgi:hypothetical protein